ncbi:hypothetical protein M404DRAFT_26929 [Pisolithus tinctorius Marx 270]|uniref:Uncharacterized protein n=1 Tax=Pisolithus tinctorius Marx 270 TaxID=870435 RepID=A0A0C3K241_PISTI|nr:hypothetical protein M404DRAFT_26929 [Pisolithus tinctorius Marx 270]
MRPHQSEPQAPSQARLQPPKKSQDPFKRIGTCASSAVFLVTEIQEYDNGDGRSDDEPSSKHGLLYADNIIPRGTDWRICLHRSDNDPPSRPGPVCAGNIIPHGCTTKTACLFSDPPTISRSTDQRMRICG